MRFELLNICDYVKEQIPTGNLNIHNYISTENMLPDRRGVIDAENLPSGKYCCGYKAGDILVSNIRPYFKKIWYAQFDGGCSNDVLVFRAKEDVEPQFLYYVLSDDSFFEYSLSTSKGTKMPRGDKKAIMSFIVPKLSNDQQKKIVNVLKPIDDKIQINNAINQNLEQQLDALYKSWFVDLSPFDGAAPSSWKYGKLKDILKQKRDSVKPGLYTNLPYLPIDSIPMNSLALNEVRPNEEALSSLVRFKKNDILIGAMRVYFHRVALAPFDGITRSTCFTLEPYNLNFLSFALLVCNQDTSIEYAQRTSKGSTMPYAIWDGGLGDMELLVPTEDDATSFNELALPLLSKIQSSYFENTRLQNLRDILLPKLMSGELDISELDI